MKLILTILMLSCWVCVLARDKPAITVRLKITEPNFREYPNMSQVEKDVQAGLVSHLNEMLPAFRFQTTQASDTLYISIERRKNTGRIIDVDFVLRLSGKNVLNAFKQDTTVLELAPNHSYDEYQKDDPKQFVEEVVSKFRRELKVDPFITKQMQGFLIKGCVSERPDFTNKVWSLSYTHADLRLDINSRLRVTHIYKLPAGDVSLLFLGEVRSNKQLSPILVKAVNGDGFDHVTDLKEQNFRQVVGIQIIGFKRFDLTGLSR